MVNMVDRDGGISSCLGHHDRSSLVIYFVNRAVRGMLFPRRVLAPLVLVLCR